MSFKFRNLRSDVQDNVSKMIEDWSGEFADWGISSSNLLVSSINAVTIWDDLPEYGGIWLKAREIAESEQVKSQEESLPPLPYTRPFQKPLISPSTIYSHCLKDLDHSVVLGEERIVHPVYAIDGSDQVAYEFTRGHKGGMGIATYGWVSTDSNKTVCKHPQHKIMQLVPADIQDVQNFAAIHFGKYPHLNPDSMRVRNYAALRRTQLEFILLSNLIDQVEPGSIIVVDGFLKAMFSPPVRFIHEAGKRAARKGVVLVGVAKTSKMDMLLHFQEFWNGPGRTYSGWIRPPAPIIDRAFPSKSDEDANQYLYLGERGRGIGVPIAATLNSQRHQYYMVDFNCYDFEAAQSYVMTSNLPEVHGMFFPLTNKDKDFIGRILAQLAFYSKQIISLGYPFPAGAAHGLVKITEYDVAKVRSMAKSSFLARGVSLRDLEESQQDLHKIVDPF